jgi:hypothetical protein
MHGSQPKAVGGRPHAGHGPTSATHRTGLTFLTLRFREPAPDAGQPGTGAPAGTAPPRGDRAATLAVHARDPARAGQIRNAAEPNSLPIPRRNQGQARSQGDRPSSKLLERGRTRFVRNPGVGRPDHQALLTPLVG